MWVRENSVGKRLRINNGFEPCPVAIDDELYPNGIFEFNITEITKYIDMNADSVTFEEISVKGVSQWFFSHK